MSAAKTRPILFSAPMVRALLAGRKTQTRRVACFAAEAAAINWVDAAKTVPRGSYTGWVRECDAPLRLPMRCPYGVPGDRLWVRETHAQFAVGEKSGLASQCVAYRATCDADGGFDYPKADGEIMRLTVTKWTPSIFMPRWASRLTLEIADIRVQRLQDIDELDSLAEGVPRASECGCEVCRRSAQMCPADAGEQIMAYAHLWDSINGKRPGCSWADNPWVWALTFARGAA